MESTYGDRTHGERPDYISLLSEVIQKTFDWGGNLVIPSFAVGRTQEILYFIRQIKEENRIRGHEDFPVYVDSPLANEATTIFSEHFYDCYDEEALALIRKGINPISFPGLKTSITSDDSKAINFVRCRPDQTSSETQSVESGQHDPFCGISGDRDPGPVSHRRSFGGEAFRRDGGCRS